MDCFVRSNGEFIRLVFLAHMIAIGRTCVAHSAELRAVITWPKLSRTAVRRMAMIALFIHPFSQVFATPSISLPYSGAYFGYVNQYAIAPANVSDQQLVITNNGTEEAWVTAFSFSPSTYSLVSHNCPSNLQPGASCAATIRFNPVGYGNGAVYGTVYVTVNGAPYYFTTSLSGTAYAPPGTLTLTSPTSTTNFGTQQYGAPLTQTLTVKNTGNTAVTANPPASSTTDYVVSGTTCAGSIAPGGTCDVQVTFIPSAAGTLSSTISLPNSGASGTVTVTGSGSGQPGVVFGGGGTVATSGTNVDDKNVKHTGVSTVNTDVTTPPCNPESPDVEECWNSFVVTAPKLPTPVPEPTDTTPTDYGYVGCVGDCSASQEEEMDKWLSQTLRTQKNPEGDGTCKVATYTPFDSPFARTMIASAERRELGFNVAIGNPVFAADPVHTGLGNKSHTQTDYKTKGGYVLSFVRTYQAQAPNASALIHQRMGPGWYSNWDKSVNYVGSSTVRVTRGDGRSILFNRQSNGTWTPPTSDIVSKLTTVYSGIYENGWTYQFGKATENYDGTGRLISVTLSTGGTYLLTYDSGRLKTVTDPAGRVLTFNYDANGRLASLVDPTGASTTYSYDDSATSALDRLGRLMSVTFPDNRARRYKYDLPTNKFALTSIATFENGVENTYVRFTYDPANGRALGNSFGASTVESQRSGRATVFYNPDGSSVTYDPSRVARDAQGNYNLITTGQYPTSATVTRAFTTIQGMVLPTSITYRHICAVCPDLSESFSYNTDGRLTSRVDRNGVTTTYTYTTDGRGLIASTTKASGTSIASTVSTTWHASFPVPIQVVEPTRTTNYTYDSAGRMLTMSIAVPGLPTRTTTNTYNAQGLLASVQGPRTDVNDTTTYTYYTSGAVSGSIYQTTNPKGQITTVNGYDAHGNPTNVVKPDGTVTTYSYDPRGRLLTKNEAGMITSNIYSTNGQLSTVTDPNGAVTTNVYDDAHRLIGKTFSNGEHVAYTLDNADRIIQTQTFDATGNLATSSSTVYDGLGRVLQTINAANKVTNYSYDANGNVTTVVDANNLATSTQYDALNRPILVTDPLAKSIATTYTADGKVASIQDPDNNTTTYTYNGFGERTALQSPDTATTTMTYNNGGLVITRIDGRGKTTNYTYDELGRLTYMSNTDGGALVQSYDVATNGVGRLATATDLSGQTSYSYDSYGRVTSKTSTLNGLGVTRSVAYVRDSLGRITGITYPSGNVLGMTYSEGRITNMTLNGSALVSAIQYFPLGGPESWLLGPNTVSTAAYIREIDLNNRVDKYSTPSGYRKLSFDDGSRITVIGDYLGTNTTPAATQTFGYDNAGRLTSFVGYTSNGNAQPNINQTQSFTYDGNGNRSTSALNSVSSTYSYQAGNNRLSTVIGGIVKTNTYDLSGNLGGDGTATMTYNAAGRMIAATVGSLSTSYVLNFQNLRAKKSNTNETAYYVYDDAGHMLGEYDQSGNAVQELFWLGDTPVAIRGTMPCLTGGSCTETATSYVWTDHLNTPRELTRINPSNQHVSIWKWDSLPFGETMPNQNPSSLGVMTFNHRFPGQYKDNETGFHQNWNREYDPRLGRYITSDPLGLSAGPNTYGYVGANPISATDMKGLDPPGTPGGLFCMAACQPDPQAWADDLRATMGYDNLEVRKVENFFFAFQNSNLNRLGPDVASGVTACYQFMFKPLSIVLGSIGLVKNDETTPSLSAYEAGIAGISLRASGVTLADLRQAAGCSCR